MEGKLSFQLFSVILDDDTESARLYGDKPYPQSMAMQVDHMGEGQQIDPRHGLPGDSRIGSRSWTYGDQDISPSAGPIQSIELHHSSIHLRGVKHRGSKSCARLWLEQVHILQPGGLYQELGQQCIRCKIMNMQVVEPAWPEH